MIDIKDNYYDYENLKAFHLDGMEYDRFGRINVIDRNAFVISLAQQTDDVELNNIVLRQWAETR